MPIFVEKSFGYQSGKSLIDLTTTHGYFFRDGNVLDTKFGIVIDHPCDYLKQLLLSISSIRPSSHEKILIEFV